MPENLPIATSQISSNFYKDLSYPPLNFTHSLVMQLFKKNMKSYSHETKERTHRIEKDMKAFLESSS